MTGQGFADGGGASVMEAMASRCFIMAHGNQFNRAVLMENALYCSSAEEVTALINDIEVLQREHREILKRDFAWVNSGDFARLSSRRAHGHSRELFVAFVEGGFTDICEDYSLL